MEAGEKTIVVALFAGTDLWAPVVRVTATVDVDQLIRDWRRRHGYEFIPVAAVVGDVNEFERFVGLELPATISIADAAYRFGRMRLDSRAHKPIFRHIRQLGPHLGASLLSEWNSAARAAG